MHRLTYIYIYILFNSFLTRTHFQPYVHIFFTQWHYFLTYFNFLEIYDRIQVFKFKLSSCIYWILINWAPFDKFINLNFRAIVRQLCFGTIKDDTLWTLKLILLKKSLGYNDIVANSSNPIIFLYFWQY